MGIKKLINQPDDLTRFVIKADEGVLVFRSERDLVCLYLQAPSENELIKILRFKDVSDPKYIGGADLLFSVKKICNNWPQFLNAVTIESSVEVLFNEKNGTVSYNKYAVEKVVSVVQVEPVIKNVLIVDDSKTIQKLLSTIIKKSTKLNLVGVAGSPSEARRIIESEKIDLITLDIHMPEMNGVEFLKTYLGDKKIPTVMISSVSINEGPLVMEALSSGAYTYIQKPSLEDLIEQSDDILEKLETVANIDVKNKTLSSKKSNSSFQSKDGLIAIGSSTGGTQALQEIFTTLPDEIPPIVVVQHIPAVFSKALADRLNTLCRFTVKEAEDSEILMPNNIYIAPGGKQMKLKRSGANIQIQITDDPPLNRFQPSVDFMFRTIPHLAVKNLTAVILTGMGKDGAAGLLELKKSGAYTIAQDEASSVVFGMPREAIHIGAATEVVSLQDMSSAIVAAFNNGIKNK